MTDTLALIGRLALVAIFFLSGINKLVGFDGTVRYIAAKPFLPLPQVLAGIAVAVEILAPLLIAFGWRTRLAALALAAFTIIVTPIFHDYWALTGGARIGQYLHFWKNIGLIGGLVLLAAHGPGGFSVDGRKQRA